MATIESILNEIEFETATVRMSKSDRAILEDVIAQMRTSHADEINYSSVTLAAKAELMLRGFLAGELTTKFGQCLASESSSRLVKLCLNIWMHGWL